MLFVVTCQDRPGHLALRQENRDAHLEWANTKESPVKMAGPLLDEAGDPVGSLLVVEAESGPLLEEFMKDDPYAQAGLFAQGTYAPFKWTVKPPADLGGPAQ